MPDMNMKTPLPHDELFNRFSWIKPGSSLHGLQFIQPRCMLTTSTPTSWVKTGTSLNKQLLHYVNVVRRFGPETGQASTERIYHH